MSKTERELWRAASDGLDLGKIGRLLRRSELGAGRLGLDIDMAVKPGLRPDMRA